MIPDLGEEAFLPKLLAHIHDELDARATSRTVPDRASVIVSGGDGQPNGIFQPAPDVSTGGGEGGDDREWRIHPSMFSAILLDRMVGGGGVIIDVDTYGHGSADSGSGGRGRTGRTRKKVQGVARHVQAITQTVMGLGTRLIHLTTSSTPADLIYHLLHPIDEEMSFGPSGLQAQSDEGEGTPIPDVIVLSGLERCQSAVWAKLVDVLVKRHVQVKDWQGAHRHGGEGGERAGSGFDRREKGRVKLPEGFTVIWIREEGMADQKPSYLVDRFSCSVSVHPSDIPSPPPFSLDSPSSPADSTHSPLIPPLLLSNLTTLLPYMHIHPPLQIHSSNLLSAISAHPRLSSSLTGRGINLFTRLVQAHRLLSARFYLPPGWEEGLERRRRIQNGEDVDAYSGVFGGRGGGERGLSGGKGGVGMWDVFAGAEPSVRDLGAGFGTSNSRRRRLAGVAGEVEEEEDDEDGDDPYATPTNVEGVFWTALRHRVRYREERDEVMWLLKGTASDVLAEVADAGAGGKKKEQESRKRANEVDQILSKILSSV